MVGKTMTPRTLRDISLELQRIQQVRREITIQLRQAEFAHKHIDLLRQKMDNEGLPGSDEPFNTPLLELEHHADYLAKIASRIKDLSQFLRSNRVEDWK